MINVSQIERFATHDGPGIRTTVFLKGCPLHCPWCANPETWSVRPFIMHNAQKCVGCQKCAHVCPHQAISFKDMTFHIDARKCQLCQSCVHHCLQSTLSVNGRSMDNEDVIRIVLKDRDYYEESGGGVTFSGGEPLFQGQASIDLLKAAKEAGLHIAIETTGNYAQSLLKEASEYVDLFLFDIKHVDHQKLKEVTGMNPDIVFSNFEYLARTRPHNVIARIPVIPSFNAETIDDILAYLKQFDVKVNLLPFHNLGKNKWHQLDRDYQYEDLTTMKAETLKRYENDQVSIGG